MPTPLAHTMTGLALHRLGGPPAAPSRWWGAWIVFCAAAPDLDLVVSWIATGAPGTWHRLWSHSLSAALVAGLLGAVLFAGRGALRAALLSTGAVTSHIALDLVTGHDLGLHQAYGVALLSPFVPERFHLPLSVLPGKGPGLLTARNVAVGAFELVVFGLTLTAVWALTARRTAPEDVS